MSPARRSLASERGSQPNSQYHFRCRQTGTYVDNQRLWRVDKTRAIGHGNVNDHLICWEWRAGRCFRGDKCLFLHEHKASGTVRGSNGRQSSQPASKGSNQSNRKAQKSRTSQVEKRDEDSKGLREAESIKEEENEHSQEEERRADSERLCEAQRRESERLAQEVQWKEEAAVVEQYLVFDSTPSLVLCGAGLAIQNIVPGFELSQTTIENLPAGVADVTHSSAAVASASPKSTDAGDICPVCYTDALNPEQLGCGHIYCAGCLGHYLSSAGDNKAFPLICIGNDANCNTRISIPFIKRFLPTQTLQHLLEVAFTHYLDQHPQDYKYCMTPDCKQVYRRQTEPGSLQCPSCLFTICPACDEESHSGLSCQENQLQQDPVGAEQERLNEQLGLKKCPRCNAWIEKDGGCNHMSCKCGAHICWKCMGVFDKDQIYRHMKEAHGTIYEEHQIIRLALQLAPGIRQIIQEIRVVYRSLDPVVMRAQIPDRRQRVTLLRLGAEDRRRRARDLCEVCQQLMQQLEMLDEERAPRVEGGAAQERQEDRRRPEVELLRRQWRVILAELRHLEELQRRSDEEQRRLEGRLLRQEEKRRRRAARQAGGGGSCVVM